MSTFESLPGLLNIKITQGDTFSCDLDFTTDMTGYSVESWVIGTPRGDVIVPLTVTEVSEPDGRLTISLTPAQTSAIPRGTYRWKIRWTTDAGEVRMVLGGFFEVSG